MEGVMQTKILPAKILNYKCWVKCIDPQVLKHTFQNVLEECEFLILDFSEKHFPEQGYTGFWLLAESHLAIHTFPHDGWAYIELSSCNEEKANEFTVYCNQLPFEVTNDTIQKSIP